MAFVFHLLGQLTLLLDLLYVVQHLIYFSVLLLLSDHVELINICLVDSYGFEFGSLASILLFSLSLIVILNLLHVFNH